MNTSAPIALVTGGGRGIGSAIARHLAKQGACIILTYRHDRSSAEATVTAIRAEGGHAAALPLDVTAVKTFEAVSHDLRAMLQNQFATDRFDYLINNAGTGLQKSIMETTEEEFDEMVNVHFKATFFLTQKLVPLLRDQGRIVNISSGLARFSLPGSSAYAAAKGAVEVLTRYMAKEFSARGISVNVIAPGAVATDFRGGAVRDNAAINKHVAELTALGRVGLPDDIGAAVAFLLSPGNRWITGQRIEVSGGMFL